MIEALCLLMVCTAIAVELAIRQRPRDPSGNVIGFSLLEAYRFRRMVDRQIRRDARRAQRTTPTLWR